mgnify:CR=1 FL=1
MSEAKHTPGPWIVDTDYIIQDGGTSDENTISIVGDQEEWKANAHLIAAAPELLDALDEAQQFILNGIQYGYINMPDKDCGDSALETPAKIEAAIKKARGQG